MTFGKLAYNKSITAHNLIGGECSSECITLTGANPEISDRGALFLKGHHQPRASRRCERGERGEASTGGLGGPPPENFENKPP